MAFFKLGKTLRPQIYIDTSVIGGYFDEEFEEATKQLFDRIKAKDFDIYFSEVNETELSLAPQHIRDIKNLLFNSINLKLGYPLIDIRTPLEFLKI